MNLVQNYPLAMVHLVNPDTRFQELQSGKISVSLKIKNKEQLEKI